MSSIDLLLCSGAYEIYPLQEDTVQLELVQPLLCALQESCLLMLLLRASLPAKHEYKSTASCAVWCGHNLKLTGRKSFCCKVLQGSLSSCNLRHAPFKTALLALFGADCCLHSM